MSERDDRGDRLRRLLREEVETPAVPTVPWGEIRAKAYGASIGGARYGWWAAVAVFLLVLLSLGPLRHASVGPGPTPAGHPAHGGKPGSSAKGAAACLPEWERVDMRLAATTTLPVATTEVVGHGNMAARITQHNLAVWLGDPQGTQATVSAILAGWHVQGLQATRGSSRLVLQHTRNGETLLLEEKNLTQGQSVLLAGGDSGGVSVGSLRFGGDLGVAVGPYTFAFQGNTKGVASIHGAVQALIEAASMPGGMPGNYYFAWPVKPPPTNYYGPNGGPPSIDPAGPLSSKNVLCPQNGTQTFMGFENGYVVPVSVSIVVGANGLSWGFAPGRFMVDWDHAGVDSALWYQIPAITVPGP